MRKPTIKKQKKRKAENKDRTTGQALERALKFLGYRSRSEAEIRTKLTQEGFSEKTIEAALEKLRSLKFVDDREFARSWARQRAAIRGLGPVRIEQELLEKGVVRSLSGPILKELFNEGSEKEKARALLERRFKTSNLEELRIKKRAGAFLYRRGYHRAIIAEILGEEE